MITYFFLKSPRIFVSNTLKPNLTEMPIPKSANNKSMPRQAMQKTTPEAKVKPKPAKTKPELNSKVPKEAGTGDIEPRLAKPKTANDFNNCHLLVKRKNKR